MLVFNKFYVLVALSKPSVLDKARVYVIWPYHTFGDRIKVCMSVIHCYAS